VNTTSSLSADGPKSSSNLADEVQTLLCRLSDDTEDFIRSVYVQLKRSPVIVLYTDEQIDDLRLLCTQDCPSALRSVLSVDRTFNLSSLYVTVMVYRNRKAVRKCNQEPPIFIGPIMLHGDGRFATYHHFFSAISAALNGTALASSELVCDGLVVGSDEELAMVSAAKSAFPRANHLFCMLHCKDNVRQHLSSVGIPTNVRENVISHLFGAAGVVESPDEDTQDDRIADTLQYVRQNAGDAATYIQERILPKITDNNRLKWRETWLGQHQWTNNNSESANSLLKLQVCQRIRTRFTAAQLCTKLYKLLCCYVAKELNVFVS